MYPLDPMGHRPDYQQQRWQQGQEPSDGNKALWVLGVMAGALGLWVVISAI